MVPWYILWPLRKAAVIPVGIISIVAVGSAYGSFDLAKRVTRRALPWGDVRQYDKELLEKKMKSKVGTVLPSVLATAVGVAIIAIREKMMLPPIPKAPDLPIGEDIPMQVRLRNAGVMALHSVVHYPYRFRFTSGFISGLGGGVAYSVLQWILFRQVIAEGTKRQQQQHQQKTEDEGSNSKNEGEGGILYMMRATFFGGETKKRSKMMEGAEQQNGVDEQSMIAHNSIQYDTSLYGSNNGTSGYDENTHHRREEEGDEEENHNDDNNNKTADHLRAERLQKQQQQLQQQQQQRQLAASQYPSSAQKQQHQWSLQYDDSDDIYGSSSVHPSSYQSQQQQQQQQQQKQREQQQQQQQQSDQQHAEQHGYADEEDAITNSYSDKFGGREEDPYAKKQHQQ